MRARLWLSLVVVLACSATANAQTDVKVGIGISINPLAQTSPLVSAAVLGGLISFYVPINIGDKFKIEPELGYWRVKQKASGDGINAEQTLTQWRLAAGLLYMFPQKASLTPYIGPRVGIVKSSRTQKFDTSEDKVSQTDFFLGLALGGEYYFSSHFTLGGEFQFNYISIGEPDVEGVPSTVEFDTDFFSTNGLVFIRWYF